MSARIQETRQYAALRVRTSDYGFQAGRGLAAQPESMSNPPISELDPVWSLTPMTSLAAISLAGRSDGHSRLPATAVAIACRHDVGEPPVRRRGDRGQRC
jgi:hypothetical protein